jgi:hypothetical protein
MTTREHPEWEKENTLTSPSDRDPLNKFKGDQGAPQLTETEVQSAVKSLNNTSFVDKFPKVERRYADPPLSLQTIGLISWVPAKGATPNEQGIYGFAKLRGNFATEIEANERAEYIIRNVDSYHQIYHGYVGRPFPLTNNPKFVAEVSEVDIRKNTTDSISNNIKNKKDEEQRVADEIKDREKMLLSDTTDKDGDDPYELYTTLKVKKAQITWTYLETKKKLDEMKEIIIKTTSELNELDAQSDDYKKKYYDKYMEARRQSGLSDKQHEDNFIKFMVEDVDLGF